MKKGIVDWIVIAPLTILILAIGAIIPWATVDVTAKEQILREFRYTVVQETLISLLSSTNEDPLVNKDKPILEILGEYIALNGGFDKDFLTDKLDKLVESKCFVLNSSTEDFAKKECLGLEYVSTIKIPLPYNTDNEKLFEEISLVIK